MKTLLKVCLVLQFLVGGALANESLQFADSCYQARALRANGDKADAKNANLMKDAYRKAMEDADPVVKEKATEGYVKTLFFRIRFVPFDKSKRQLHVDSLKEASEAAYNKYPKNREIAHVYASALSMWGAEKNPLAAVKAGVAAKVRDVATEAKDYQVLGRAHTVLPYIPLVLSWPDNDEADKYLNMALKENPKDLNNYYFLADLRFRQKRYADALDLIKRGLARGISKNTPLEDKRGRWHLKELQKQIDEKLDKK